MSAQLAGPLHVRAPTGFDLDDRDDVAGRTRKYKIDIHRGHCILIDRGLPSVVERYGFAPGREPLVFRTSSYRRAARFALYSCHSTATLCARTLARRMCRTRGVCRTGDAVQSKMPSILRRERYQMVQRLSAARTIAEPSLQENACWNSGALESGPITRYFPVGCGSVCTIRRCVSGRIASPRNWPQAMKNSCSGVKPFPDGGGGLASSDFRNAR